MAGFLARIASLFGRTSRAAPSLPGMSDFVAPAGMPGRGPARKGTRELLQAHRTQPWLRAVTSRIAEGVASAGWTVYARAAEPVTAPVRYVRRSLPGGHVRDVAVAPTWRWGHDRIVVDRKLNAPDPRARAQHRAALASAGLLREIPDHPLLELLCEPSPDLTGRAALKVTQKWIDIKGDAFWLLVPGAGGVPAGYIPVPPHWVTGTPTPAQPYFTISYAGFIAKVDPSAVVWFRDLDPENPMARGTGIAEALADELETDESAAKYLNAWFYNSAVPSFIVSFEGASSTELEKAKAKWENEHRGYWNGHRAHFSSGKMNAVRLDSSFRDQQIIDLRKLSRDTVAQVFAVPPEMIGIIENSNRSTIDAARYIYVLGVEFPRVEFLRGEIQRQVLWRYPGSEGACLEAEIAVPEDEERRLNVFRAMPGAFALNEWRAEAGYDPLPQFEGVFPPLALPGQPDPALEPPDVADDEETDDTEEESQSGETELEPEEPMRGDPPWARGEFK